MTNSSFAKMLQEFFLRKLINQKNASPQTVSAYRDTFRLLLNFLHGQTNKNPSDLTLKDIDAGMILKFLDHLENERHNSIRTRNARLAAIRSFFRYASYVEPASPEVIQQVLALPMKRCDRPLVEFLSREEVEAIIGAPNLSTWSGNRDHTMFMTLYNTGARVSEITALRVMDVCITNSAYVKIQGKGRKERTVPLWGRTVRLVKSWLRYLGTSSDGFLFPNAQGKPLTRYGVEYRLRIAQDIAANKCSSLKTKRISPHTFRHNRGYASVAIRCGYQCDSLMAWA